MVEQICPCPLPQNEINRMPKFDGKGSGGMIFQNSKFKLELQRASLKKRVCGKFLPSSRQSR